MNALAQDAFQYLSQDVPIETQTPGMYNTLLEAALRASDMQMAKRLLQTMDDAGVAPDSRTAASALRVMVGCPVARHFTICSFWQGLTGNRACLDMQDLGR